MIYVTDLGDKALRTPLECQCTPKSIPFQFIFSDYYQPVTSGHHLLPGLRPLFNVSSVLKIMIISHCKKENIKVKLR
jgi:hypothetical protein